MKTMDLRFDAMAKCIEKPSSMDGEAALERALALQFRWIRINWAGVIEVDLPIEDDLMFLVMAYDELEACLASGRTHDIFLGDGLLVITAEKKDLVMSMDICHTPHLDKRFSRSEIVTIDVSQYRNAWCGLMRAIVTQLGLES